MLVALVKGGLPTPRTPPRPSFARSDTLLCTHSIHTPTHAHSFTHGCVYFCLQPWGLVVDYHRSRRNHLGESRYRLIVVEFGGHRVREIALAKEGNPVATIAGSGKPGPPGTGRVGVHMSANHLTTHAACSHPHSLSSSAAELPRGCGCRPLWQRLCGRLWQQQHPSHRCGWHKDQDCGPQTPQRVPQSAIRLLRWPSGAGVDTHT